MPEGGVPTGEGGVPCGEPVDVGLAVAVGLPTGVPVAVPIGVAVPVPVGVPVAVAVGVTVPPGIDVFVGVGDPPEGLNANVCSNTIIGMTMVPDCVCARRTTTPPLPTLPVSVKGMFWEIAPRRLIVKVPRLAT